MCAVTRARDFVYIRCDRKVRGSFLVNCLFERITRFTSRIRNRLWKYTYFLSMNYSIHSHLGCTRSFQLASSCVLSFFCFRNSLSLKEYILYYIYFWKEEKLRSDGEKVRLKWLIRCSIVVLSLFIRFMIDWFFPLLLDFR